MSFDWPSAIIPRTLAWGITKSGVQFRSPFAGSIEANEFPGAYWTASIVLPEIPLRLSGDAEAFFARCAGGTETINVPYWRRLQPRGTLRGTPTLQTPAVRGDLALNLIVASGTTVTLEAGDMIGAGAQLFQCFQRCSTVSGLLTVPLVNRVRGPIAAGTAIVWNRPTCLMLMPSQSSLASYVPGAMSGMPVDLEETGNPT